MTRSAFKKLWTIALILVMGVSVFIYRKAADYETEIETYKVEKQSKTSELNRGSQMSADIARLDSLTVDETEATKLEILRDLDLAVSDLKFDLTSKVSKDFGRVKLYTRRFQMSGTLPYAEVMDEIDRLHNTRKMVITQISLKPSRKEYGDKVEFVIGGVIYGLEKHKG